MQERSSVTIAIIRTEQDTERKVGGGGDVTCIKVQSVMILRVPTTVQGRSTPNCTRKVQVVRFHGDHFNTNEIIEVHCLHVEKNATKF